MLFRTRDGGQKWKAISGDLTRNDIHAVRRDVAFFLWKLAAIAASDWSNGAFPLRRLRTLGSCAAALAMRPRAALAALTWT